MSQRFRIAMFALIGLVIALDQWSKSLILGNSAFNARPCLDPNVACGGIDVSGVFDLTMVWNRGISFGIGQSEGIMRWLLVIMTLAIATGFAIWLWRAVRTWTALALALVVGGAIGNVIDRARFGAVVDFIDFSGIFRPYFFNYIFNVADAAICVGAVLLFVDQFLMSRQDGLVGTGTGNDNGEDAP